VPLESPNLIRVQVALFLVFYQ